jgi:formylglycine-generating enzyme required for sulfatase activity
MMTSRISLAFVLLLLVPSLAHAASRVALIVGNSAYVHAGELPNPKNDAADMAALLKEIGFAVITAIDLDRAGFELKLREFGSALNDAGVALFFYAGHGLQVGGRNYLVPVDAELATPAAMRTELVPLDAVVRAMAASTGYKLIFLDACRNNPLSTNLAQAGDQRATPRAGLAPVGSGADTVISYSAQPGNVAIDGEGRNSPFTKALTTNLRVDADLVSVLARVRNQVRVDTRGKQIPWDHSSLRTAYHLHRDTAPPPVTEATLTWQRVDRSNLIALEAFVRSYPGSPEAEQARNRMTSIPLCVSIRVAPDRRLPCVKPVVGRERPGRDPTSFRECTDCPEMVIVPWGRFTMGSPVTEPGRSVGEDQVSIVLPRYFSISQSAVTIAEWEACVTAGGCKPHDRIVGSPEPPDKARAEATFSGAQSYVWWLAAKTGGRYRLPSEAEWEYTIRAGTSTAYWWGSAMADRPIPASDHPWTIRSTGLEWVADCWTDRISGVPEDGRAQVTGDCSRRVVRGSADAGAASSRSANRGQAPPATGGIGFRVLREYN